jgi:cobalt-zinc-cadmium efflux system outer membrane protein
MLISYAVYTNRRRCSVVFKAAFALALLATVSACATVDPAQDTAEINRLLTERGSPVLGWYANESVSDEATVQAWLAEPMTAERAVQMAMLRSPRLQEQYGELGLARADILEAVQIANPRIGASRTSVEDGPGTAIAYGLAMPLVDLLVLPSRVRLAQAELERARFQIANAVMEVSLEVEAAWYTYVAAQQVAEMRAAVAEGLGVSADMAQRYFNAGNISELQLSREQAAASQARIDAARAAVDARMARLDLTTLIGLTGPEADWQASTVLPLPVVTEDDPAELRRMATEQSLVLLAARREAEISANAAGVTRAFRLLGDTGIGYEREEETDGARLSGPTLELELPIFNQGQARVARAEAQLRVARARLAHFELSSDNAVDAGAQRVQVLSDIVRIHREALVPQRETVVARSQEEQNYMLIGVFELIRAKTEEYDAYQSLLEAVRDYWLARVDLMRVVGSRLPSEQQAGEPTPSVSEILNLQGRGAMQGMDHSQHGSDPAASTPAPALDHSNHGGQP